MGGLTLGWVADLGCGCHDLLMRKNVIISVLVTLLLPTTAAAAPGDLDPTFGASGLLISEVDERNAAGETEFEDVLALGDGRVVAVGTTYRRERRGGHRRSRSRAIVARFRANGRLDRTFSDNGFALINTEEPQDEGVALAAGPKSSVMVGLRSGSGDQYELDGPDGRRAPAPEWTARPYLRRERHHDAPLAGGPPLDEPGRRPHRRTGRGARSPWGSSRRTTSHGNPQDVSITRLTRRGRLDASFAGDGKLVLSLEGLAENGLGEIGLDEERPTGVDVDSQNRVVIAGNSVDYEPPRGVHGVLRLTPDGALDLAFSDDGWHPTPRRSFGWMGSP